MKDKYLIKKIFAFLLVFHMVFGIFSILGVGNVYAKKGSIKKAQESVKYIYFDLAAGSVNITSSTYTGYIYVTGIEDPVTVTGPHSNTNKYYIYQSNLTDESSPGYFKKTGYPTLNDSINFTGCLVPKYSRVSYDNKTWSNYITNNINVKMVSQNFDNAAKNSGRDATKNNITFGPGAIYDTTIDNIWSTYHINSSARTTGGITAHLGTARNTNIQIKLKGDNRFGNIHYHSWQEKNNQIVFSNGDSDSDPGSITVADFVNQWQFNHWCSAIGGNDDSFDRSDGIVIDGGVIYAGTTSEDNCTAIGGGGNEYGSVTINRGTITAVAATTGTAIGGGIGWNGAGGNTDVTITGGTIYAYNFGVDNSSSDKFEHYVPAVAIGGGSSQNSNGNSHTIVDISGGIVYAQSMGGAAIGGGGSAKRLGGNATINISGGTVIAKSTSGKFKGTLDPDIVDIPAGVSIGGGTGNTGGGSVTLNIDGGILRTGSIGGGKTNGTGNIGSAIVKITDGNIIGQVVMAGGEGSNCSFTMSGGKIHSTNLITGNKITDINDPNEDVEIVYLEKNGGAVFMTDPNGVTKISGDGTISNCTAELGGAIYMSGGKFELSGNAVINNNTATQNGGGVYVGDGDVDVLGGTINNNTAGQNGGGIYVAGNYSMTDGNVLSNNANYGGGIYVNDGIVTMYGGNVDHNVSTESGGGMYVSCDKKDAIVDIFSGSISDNQSKIGGGVSVVSNSDSHIYVTVGVNCVHPNLEDGIYDSFAYPSDSKECGEAHEEHVNHIDGLTHSTCPQIKNNVALNNGGGLFLNSPNTNLIFYCVIEDGNIANGESQSYDMDVKGGHVEIGDKTYDYKTNEPAKGNIIMQDSILVEGGIVDIYGTMENPKFTASITVEIEDNSDRFTDHRITDKDHIIAYKVHYYENFYNTGSYKAMQYPDKDHEGTTGSHRYDFTVMASTFLNEGYRITGWNTKPDGTGDYYYVNDTYNLEELYNQGKLGAYNLSNEYDGTLLVIYALWEKNGYVLNFNPNVPVGEPYTGTMENQIVQVGKPVDETIVKSINKNQFKRIGYIFIGWSLKAIPLEGDQIYEDGYIIPDKKDFTTVNGATINLYAQWELCEHVDSLVYTAIENVMTQSCSKCGGHTATVTITTINYVYDGDFHLAISSFSTNWKGDKPNISYLMEASDWDAKDQVVTEWSNNPQPIHAGTYTAKIIMGDVTAEATYTISPADQETPDAPTIIFKVSEDGKSIIEITTPTGDNLTYWIKELVLPEEEVVLSAYPNYQTSNQFTNIPYGHYYYFYAKKAATRDYNESTPSRSEAYLADGGNIVFIKNATGIKVIPNIGAGVFKYIVSADVNYHLRGYTDNLDSKYYQEDPNILIDAVSMASAIPNATDAKCESGAIKLNRVVNDDNKSYTYTVKFEDNKVAYYQITLDFSGAVKDASVTEKGIDGQLFSDFNSKVISISSDSAFTVRFILSNYIPEEYKGQALSFSKVLPIGTTIIMKTKDMDDNDCYWYYKVESVDIQCISLTNFTAMGANEKFAFDKTGTDPKTITYQFIVDFSQVENNDITDNLALSLKLTSSESFSAPNIPASGINHISLNINAEAQFNLSLNTSSEKPAELNCDYTESVGAASIWNGKKNALVLEAPTNAPADLSITVVTEGKTVVYKMNANRKFIIPLGEIESKTVQIALNSSLFTNQEVAYVFKTQWFVSQSSADISPLNGKLVQSTDLTLSCKNDSIASIRIDGTEHFYEVAGTIQVNVNYAGIPDESIVKAYLQSRNALGEYIDTALDVLIDTKEGTSKSISFKLGQMEKGSYRIYVIVQDKGMNICEVPYYFVIV